MCPTTFRGYRTCSIGKYHVGPKPVYRFDKFANKGLEGGSRSAVYRAIKAGKLKARKNGRRTVILVSDLTRFLETLPDFHDQTAP